MGRTITVDDLLADEYRALIEEILDFSEDEDFVTEHHTPDLKERESDELTTRDVARRVVQRRLQADRGEQAEGNHGAQRISSARQR